LTHDTTKPSVPALSAEELERLRRFLWLHHGHSGLYGDDGEMQCSRCSKFGVWDYRREPLAKLLDAAENAVFAEAYREASRPQPASIPVELLRKHYLCGIQCNHERKIDRAICACSEWNCPPQPTVGEAVERWIEHVASRTDLTRPAPSAPQDKARCDCGTLLECATFIENGEEVRHHNYCPKCDGGEAAPAPVLSPEEYTPEGDIFWDPEDQEVGHSDPYDILSNFAPGEIIEIEQAKRLHNFYGFYLSTEKHERYFLTQEAAEAKLAEVESAVPQEGK
jgi:hypothetical protein